MRKLLFFSIAMSTLLILGLKANSNAANPSANVQNGNIWRYTGSATPVVDQNFNEPLSNTAVRISQQVIADNGGGSFDVELKVQIGDGVAYMRYESVVFLLDDSGSISDAAFTQMKQACIAMVNAFPSNINVQFGIVTFGAASKIVQPLTSDRSTVISRFNSYVRMRSNTNLYAGLRDAENILNIYGAYGAKHIVLITDGSPNALPSGVAGTPMTATQNKILELKNKGIFMYVAGFGGANPSFFSQAASRTDICQIVNSATALTALLTNLNPVSGFLGSITQHASAGVAVNMGDGIDFVAVQSNNGGAHDLTSGNGTLFWVPTANSGQPQQEASRLVYRVQIHKTKFWEWIKSMGEIQRVTHLYPSLANPIKANTAFTTTVSASTSATTPVTASKTTPVTASKTTPVTASKTTPVTASKTATATSTTITPATADSLTSEFIPVSSSAVFSYSVGGNSKTVAFDIPKVRMAPTSEHIHDWGEWEVSIPVTCLADGQSIRRCTFDPSHIETRVDVSYGHTYLLTDHKDATPTENGHDYYECSECGDAYTVQIMATGVDKNVYSVTPMAYVQKLNGNQNRLFITVTVEYNNATTEVFEWNGLINNNAAGTYQVGDYQVYVDTKGNVQIRQCYIVE